MALWELLWSTNFLNIPTIHIYGDSKIIIDFVGSMQQYPNHHYKVGCYKSHPFGIHTISLQYSILAQNSTKLLMDYLKNDYKTS